MYPVSRVPFNLTRKRELSSQVIQRWTIKAILVNDPPPSHPPSISHPLLPQPSFLCKLGNKRLLCIRLEKCTNVSVCLIWDLCVFWPPFLSFPFCRDQAQVLSNDYLLKASIFHCIISSDLLPQDQWTLLEHVSVGLRWSSTCSLQETRDKVILLPQVMPSQFQSSVRPYYLHYMPSSFAVVTINVAKTKFGLLFYLQKHIAKVNCLVVNYLSLSALFTAVVGTLVR